MYAHSKKKEEKGYRKKGNKAKKINNYNNTKWNTLIILLFYCITRLKTVKWSYTYTYKHTFILSLTPIQKHMFEELKLDMKVQEWKKKKTKWKRIQKCKVVLSLLFCFVVLVEFFYYLYIFISLFPLLFLLLLF